MRKFLISLPVSAMIGKQGKHLTTAKIFKKVFNVACNSNYIIAQFSAYNCCIKIMVDTCKIMENVHMTKVIFLHHFCD